MHPLVSIVIVTYNDKENLICCLSSLISQTFPKDKMEIIVVDDGSTDGTKKTLNETFSEIKVISKDNCGPDNSRIHGIEEATGEIVSFIDSDCIASREWLVNSVQSLKENRVLIVGGRILHRGNFWTRLIGVSDFGGFQSGKKKETKNIPTCNMSVARNIFNTYSFDPNLRVGGDVIFCSELRKNGYKLIYDPKITVIHRPEGSFSAFMRRAFRYGEGFVDIRMLDSTLPYAGIVRFGLPGVVFITLARTFLDWQRLICHRKGFGIKFHEIIPAMILLLLKRAVSLVGAIKGYRYRKRRACEFST